MKKKKNATFGNFTERQILFKNTSRLAKIQLKESKLLVEEIIYWLLILNLTKLLHVDSDATICLILSILLMRNQM